jgi:broad specificity phosphatase PhoE
MGYPSKIILLRHGLSLGNVDPQAYVDYSDDKIPLIDVGVTQAKEAGTILDSTLSNDVSLDVYCSPYLRTVQTLEGATSTINRTVNFVKHDSRLREQHWGDFDTIDEQNVALTGYSRDPMFYRYPNNGESGLEAQDRLASFVDSIKANIYRDDKTDPYDILVVSHGMSIRLMVGHIMGWTASEIASKRYPRNCEPLILEQTKPNSVDYEIKVDLNYTTTT